MNHKIKIMKTLLLGSLMAVVSLNSFANQMEKHVQANYSNSIEISIPNKIGDDLKSQIEFHQRNVDILWNQYDLMVARIQGTKGNRAELESDRSYFVQVHKQNIQKGIAVEASEKAIEDIERKFQKDLSKREAYEAKEIAHLQRSLKAALNLEQRKVEMLKRKNAKHVDEETLAKLQELDHHFSQSAQRLQDLQENPYKISIASEK